MTELKPEIRPASPNYLPLVEEIQRDPFNDVVWNNVIELARSEEGKEGIRNYYSEVPLEELIDIGKKIRELEGNRDEQYKLLQRNCSNGENWYQIIMGHINDKMFKPIAEELERSSEGLVWPQGLDIGTGTGNTIRSIAPYFEKVIGMDKLGDILAKQKEEGQLPNNVDLVSADATKFPIADSSIDVAVSNGLLYYLKKEQVKEFVKELSRVLVAGGVYYQGLIHARNKDSKLPVIEEEYLQNAKGILICLIDSMITQKEDPTDWSLNDVYQMFISLGMEVEMSDLNDEGVWYLEARKV